MLSFEDLLNASFSKLDDAVDDWTTVVTKLERLATGGAHRMASLAEQAKWKGENATVTKPFIKKTAKEFSDAHTEAVSIRNILRDACTSFKEAQKRLQSLIDDAPANMTIDPYGTVGHIRSDSRSKDNKDPVPTVEEIERYQARIDKVLKDATEVDKEVARALHTLVDKNPYNFADVHYDSLRAADTKLALADANAALRLVRKSGLSKEDLSKLDKLFDQHANDKIFATRFYGQLGPEEALRFNAKLATGVSLYGDSGEVKTAADLQKHLGTTLAAATLHVGKDGYLDSEWVEGLKKAGHQRIDMRSEGYWQAIPYGYQSLGPLLKSGTFGKGFLKELNADMLQMDKQLHGRWPSASNNQWYIDLSNDLRHSKFTGQDPIVGLLDANSRCPEGAEGLFKDKSDLNHLLKSSVEGGQRSDVLGHALETAVYGYRYDQVPPATAPEHTGAQTRIMKNIIDAISKDASLVNTEIGDSFGHMAAAYMPEINRSVAGPGVFSTEQIFPTGDKTDVTFLESDVHRFLYALARDPEAYAAVTYAQNAYASNAIEYRLAHPEEFEGKPEEAVKLIAENTGHIQGILGHSRADAAKADQLAADEATNEAFKTQSDWFKTMASAGISTAAAAYPPTSAVGATLGSIGSAFGSSAVGQVIDNIYSGREVDGMDQAVYRVSHDLDNTKNSTISATQWAGQAAIAAHDAPIKRGTMDLIIGEGVKEGWSWSDTALDDYQNRP
ncbi:hypothetical protein PS467_29820 [Streptomyces luomodiensis]|uniref:WXG100 family type VII secretion target n=1 Tax=Streptomyces luomodiensis TaxID=3026192 RepID=A0ABY9V2X6_9ACTN|nr:hypothetical protein [Streptomyces sp. SCA4-21]WNE99231.1 hypothetical protein PS467_29820 [Streptomyces sp. SCA4-21]